MNPRMLHPATAALAVLLVVTLAPAARAITYRNPAHPIDAGSVGIGLFAERIERDTHVGAAPSRDTEFQALGASVDYGLLPNGALELTAAAASFRPRTGSRARSGEGSLDGPEAGLTYRHNLSGDALAPGAAPFSALRWGLLAGARIGTLESNQAELDYTRIDVALGTATPLGGPFSLYGGVALSDIQGTWTDVPTGLKRDVDAESNRGLFAGVELYTGRSLLGGLELHGSSDQGLAAYLVWLL